MIVLTKDLLLNVLQAAVDGLEANGYDDNGYYRPYSEGNFTTDVAIEDHGGAYVLCNPTTGEFIVDVSCTFGHGSKYNRDECIEDQETASMLVKVEDGVLVGRQLLNEHPSLKSFMQVPPHMLNEVLPQVETSAD